MKKRIIVFLSITFIFQMMLIAQNSAATANRNTALRCLRLAENCLLGGDWDNAFRQAELGLSYDDSVSDLVYVKAASLINLGKSKNEVLEIISQAFKKDNWLGYSLNGARILYADLLCDTGDYEASLHMLDSEPFILSADAEFIRVKNFYRMATEKSLSDARLKVNTARRIYPTDSRFPTIFFMFEYAFMSEALRTGLHYQIDDTVSTIARAYIAKLPDYTDLNNEVEILASFFADEKEKLRLLKAIDSKNTRANPYMVIAGLRNGIYSDSQAFDLFFKSVDNEIPCELLEDFTLALTEADIKVKLAEYLTAFSGKITVDLNIDLQNELEILYENGRPSEIYYDKNKDGVMEICAKCDFGAPITVEYPQQQVSLTYAAYPELSKIFFAREGRTFYFLHEDLNHKPFTFIADPVFGLVGVDFFIPSPEADLQIPSAEQVVNLAASVELPNSERTESTVLYSADAGKLYFANFYQGEKRYAYADFSTGLPFLRYVDADDDGYFETTEEYDSDALISQPDYIEGVFGKAAIPANLYLKKLQIDRNANTFYEYTEEYYEHDGKICSWDNDDDGFIDFSYEKSPQPEDEALLESYVFYRRDNPSIAIQFIDSIPVKLTIGDSEEIIYAGKSDGFYWVAEEGSDEMEALALRSAKNVDNGAVTVKEYEGLRFSVIKIDGTIFARILPESYEEEENADL